MQFEGFHIKFIDNPKTGHTLGMFVGGIIINPDRTEVQCVYGPYSSPSGSKDFRCKPEHVQQIHVTDAGNHIVAKTIVAPQATGKSVDDSVVQFVNARMEEGPLGLAFLQALYAFLNTGHTFRMSTIRYELSESLRKAKKQG